LIPFIPSCGFPVAVNVKLIKGFGAVVAVVKAVCNTNEYELFKVL